MLVISYVICLDASNSALGAQVDKPYNFIMYSTK